MPFARFDLSQPLFLTQPPEIHLAAFYQILQGIAALHDAGFIHRDIKPANVGVVKQTADSIEIVILDYGQTVRQLTCEPIPGRVGTVSFLAPEMEVSTYGKEVDIWASGILGVMLFQSMGKALWGNVVHQRAKWQQMVIILESFPKGSVQSLMRAMLTWDLTERITAVEALRYTCFDDFRQNME